MIGKNHLHYRIIEKLIEDGRVWCTRYNNRFHSDDGPLVVWVCVVHFLRAFLSQWSARLYPPLVKRIVETVEKGQI